MVLERFISDFYCKNGKILPDGPGYGDEANRIINAIHRMYGWLYEQLILAEVAFVYKDYTDVVYFAFNAFDITRYRTAMETSGLEDADLACRYIFDEKRIPCRFSGAIELTAPMKTFRSVNDVVSSSWECMLVRHLNTEAAYEVLNVFKERGAKAAIQATYDKHTWN